MSEITREAVLSTISTLIVEVIGEDWAADIDIGEGTSFNEDLELESIEFVYHLLINQINCHLIAHQLFYCLFRRRLVKNVVQVCVQALRYFDIPQKNYYTATIDKNEQ